MTRTEVSGGDQDGFRARSSPLACSSAGPDDRGRTAGVVADDVRNEDPFDRIRGGWGHLLPVGIAGVWLIYLLDPLHDILARPPGVQRDVGVAATAFFAVAYVAVFFQARRRRWVSLESGSTYLPFGMDRVIAVLLVVMVGCFAVMIPTAGSSSTAAVVYIVAAVMMVTPLRFGWSISLLAVAGSEIAASVVPGWSTNRGAGLAVLLASVAVFGVRMALSRSVQLSAARGDLARLAVEQERNRFARDLHDILGHSLTVVTLKAELAGRLVESDPQGAIRELADLEQLSRDALADVRAAVAGYRGVTLVSELAHARSMLQAAGISADLPGAVDQVPGRYRELFGWTVREGVTNVVRHSGAQHCEIILTSTSVDVLDDGRGGGHDRSTGNGGHGLIGLSERARAMDGFVLSGPRASGGFRLRVGFRYAGTPRDLDAATADVERTSGGGRAIGEDQSSAGSRQAVGADGMDVVTPVSRAHPEPGGRR